MTEKFEFAQIDGCFAIGCWCLMQMAYGPDNREKYGAATEQINENENIAPSAKLNVTLFGLVNYDVSDVGKYLAL